MQPAAVEGDATGCVGSVHGRTDPNLKGEGSLVMLQGLRIEAAQREASR